MSVERDIIAMKHSLILGAASLLALAGCKADELSFDLRTQDILGAAQGVDSTVSFEASFSTFGSLDDGQRAQVEALEDILSSYIKVDDFELEITNTGFAVTIEGEISITTDLRSDSAYFIAVEPSDIVSGAYLVQLRTGDDFDRMENEMQAINFMLSPDAFHPTRIRLRGDDRFEIIAPGAQVDGSYYLMWRGTSEDRLTLRFAGGPFDEVGAGFLIIP